MIKPLRIAVYGFAERDAGSIASAGWLVCRGLLERGMEIDFFNYSGFVHPREFHEFTNFAFIEVARPRLRKAAVRLLWWKNRVWASFIAMFLHRVHARDVVTSMRRMQAGRRYDLVIYLGDWAFGRVGGVAALSWVQGSPATDCASVRRHAGQIIRLCGWAEFLRLRLYCLYRENLGLPVFRHSDFVVTGSEWSRRRLTDFGVPIDRIYPIPYPVDLAEFSPCTASAQAAGHVPVILWIGRIVPRKRLDLFLGACEQLLDEGTKLKVHVVGGFPFAPGYKKLLEAFRYPDLLEYRQRVARQAIPELLRNATVLVQPSEDEDFGSAVAEALACGVQVVVGPTNGTKDYIGDGGQIFNRYEVTDVKEAIRRAMAKHYAAPILVAAEARAAAERNFDANKIVDQVEQIIQRLCALQSDGSRTEAHRV
jgi:glycosyltransferase involved in cell wall biosynthesis